MRTATLFLVLAFLLPLRAHADSESFAEQLQKANQQMFPNDPNNQILKQFVEKQPEQKPAEEVKEQNDPRYRVSPSYAPGERKCELIQTNYFGKATFTMVCNPK